MRRAWGLSAVGGLLVGWACRAPAFTCSDDAQCEGGPMGGTCIEGYCAFPSDVCSSGLQWGDAAGDVSGMCVPAGVSDTDTFEATLGSDDATSRDATSLDDGPDDSPASDSLDTASDGSDGPLPGEVEFRDDELRGEFGAGTMRGVEWTGDRLTLSPNASQGLFTSRVFDAGQTVTWQTVHWHPDAPYGKPLPDGGAVEMGYLEGNVNMAANVLLMHFDDDAGGRSELPEGTEVLDASGAGSHGVVVSQGGGIPLVSGIFGSAIDDLWETRISIDTSTAPQLSFDTDDFTWAMWVRMDAACSNNQVYLGVDDSDEEFDYFAHLWLGCTDDQGSQCEGNVSSPRAAGTFRSYHDDPTDGGSYCSQSTIVGNAWHHLAVVKQGHDGATLSLYVDGVLENVNMVGFVQPIEYPNGPDFTIGGLSRGTYPAVGVFDEVAIWRRALAADEVAALHRRAVTGLQVSVRACLEPDCADDPPWGPQLSDPPQATAPGLEIPLVEPPKGRYAQYRLSLFGAGGGSPALRSVVLRGAP